MSLKKTLILGLVLVAAIFYVLKIKVPQQTEAKNKEFFLVGHTRSEIHQISLKHDNSEFVLKNNASVVASPDAIKDHSTQSATATLSPSDLVHWEVAGIVGSDLDSTNFNQLLTELFNLKLGQSLPAADLESDLGVYGLSNPELVIGLNFEGQQHQIKFGKSSQYLNKRYVQIDNQPEVYLISPELYQSAARSRSEFRNKTPINFSDADLQKVSIKSSLAAPALDAELLVAEKEGWKLVKPLSARASDEVLASLANDLRALTVADFIDSDTSNKTASSGASEPSREQIAGNPEVSLLLEFKPETKRVPLEIKLINKVVPAAKDVSETTEKTSGTVTNTYFILGSNPTVYKTSGDTVVKMPRIVDDLRLKKYLQFATDQTVQVEVMSAGSESSLLMTQDADQQWKVGDKIGDRAFIEQYLKNLNELSAVAYPKETRDFGFANPRLKVKLKIKDFNLESTDPTKQKYTERILVIGNTTESSDYSGNGYYAAVDELKEPFIISESGFSHVVPKADALVKIEESPSVTPSPQALDLSGK